MNEQLQGTIVYGSKYLELAGPPSGDLANINPAPISPSGLTLTTALFRATLRCGLSSKGKAMFYILERVDRFISELN
jgi:hypothetical protein